MTTLGVLAMQDLTAWRADYDPTKVAGKLGPYSLQHLYSNGFDLLWSDAAQNKPLAATIPSKVRAKLRTRYPAWQGLATALANAGTVASSEAIISTFENVGIAAAHLRASRVPPFARTPHVMIVCWLAEWALHADEAQLASTAKALKGADRIVVFSSNQVEILAERLGVPSTNIAVVPFGIDNTFFSSLDGPAEGGGVVAIGRDRSRDYKTMLDAVRTLDVPVTLACYPENLAGLHVPANVTVRTGIDHVEYRALLASADLVVTPTIAPAYPSGQTTMLEAMAMGKACLTTDSLAMREYVDDGTNGALTPLQDAEAMADAIANLMADKALRQSLGANAKESVTNTFNQQAMWASVSGTVREVLA